MDSDIDAWLPLPPAALHILLALAGEERHGYGITKEIERQSDGRYKLGPGTLYDNLHKLLEDGVVEESEGNSLTENSRRRYYRLTAFGRGLLAAEVSRLEKLLRQAKAHLKPANFRV